MWTQAETETCSQLRDGVSIVRYDWNFDWRDPWAANDFPQEWQDLGPKPEHTYDWSPPPDNVYYAAVRVTDGEGITGISELLIAVTSQPIAELTTDENPVSGDFPLEVRFDASASYDPDSGTEPGDGIVKYEFDFGKGSGWEDYGTDPTHTYIYNEGFIARVRVTDVSGSTKVSDLVFGSRQGNWWMRGHDPKHTGVSAYTGPQTNHMDWSTTIGGGGQVKSSPVIGSDGTVYVGCSDSSLYAVNPDGTEKWSYLIGVDVRSSPAI